jgi:hypothetical protein
VWFISHNPKLLKQLQVMLQQFQYPLCTIFDLREIEDLVQTLNPEVLLIDSELLNQIPAVLLERGSAQSNEVNHTEILLIGNPQSQPTPIQTSLSWIDWPPDSGQFKQYLLGHAPSLSSLAIADAQEDLTHALFDLMSALTSPLPEDLHIHVHPSHRKTIEQLALSPQWRRWLLSVDLNYPLQFYTRQSPGTETQASILLRYLLQLGILTTHDHTIAPPTPIQEATDQSAVAEDTPLNILRIIIFGLRGQWKEDLVFALQQISEKQATSIQRKSSLHIAYLPKSELARIPLNQNTLLLCYGLLNEEQLDPLLKKINGSVDAFIFFAETTYELEQSYIRDLRNHLLLLYPVPSLLLISDSPSFKTPLPIPSSTAPNQTTLKVDKLDDLNTYRAIYTLLKLTKYSNLLPPPPSYNKLPTIN